MINLLRFVVLVFAASFVLLVLGFTVFEGFDRSYIPIVLKTALVVAVFALSYKYFALRMDEKRKNNENDRDGIE